MSFQQFFRNPPVAYRLVPFWFWNDEMDTEEIVRQVGEMAEKGVGGFFLCARQGLRTPYLSEQWFRLVAVAIEAARQYGLETWLYDEYPYPSGMSGGEVALEHPEARHRQFRHHSLVVSGPRDLTYELPWARVLAAKAVPLEETTGEMRWSDAVELTPHIGSVPAQSVFQFTGLTEYTRKRFFTASPRKQLVWNVPPGRWHMIFFLEEEITDFKYFGTYIDPCNREAVQTFLRTTHERYAHFFYEQFGREIKGFFTDEVGLLGRIPWSACLPLWAREQHGAEIVENLPALFYPIEGKSAQARYQFFQYLHLLLNESYHQQISQWCEQHRLQYVTEVPGMRMTTQLYSHIPGGDSAHEKVGRALDGIVDQNALSLRADPKIVSSLASQLGVERAMIECFHSVGWSMTLQDAKWMLDRLAACGINFFVFHAFYYSMNGLRKHDAPPSQFFQNPYWPHFRQLADYAGRLSYAMSQGRACVSIAVLHPVTSFWTHMGNPLQNFGYCGNDVAEERALERLKRDWAYLCKQLLLHQIDYDHLDPEMLARATIEDGQISIGHARYDVLILPPLTNLEGAAWTQVKAFLRGGGKVISVGLLPYECIEQGQEREAEILQWFGLTASPRQNYWREPAERSLDHAEAGQEQVAPWIKGQYTTYFLPVGGDFQQARGMTHLLALLQQITSPLIMLELADREREAFLIRQRSLPDGASLIFLTNQADTETIVRLRLAKQSGKPGIARLDLVSGQTSAFPVEQTESGWLVSLPFAAYESYLLHYIPHEETLVTRQAPQSRPWLFELDKHPWQVTAQQNNILRFGVFHFTLDQQNSGLTLRWHEGWAGQAWPQVPTRPLINQCAEIATTQAVPMQFQQSFGLPMQSSLAYPLSCWYQSSFIVEQLPLMCKLVMDASAIGGKYSCYLNGQEIVAQNRMPVHEHGFPQQGYEIQSLLRQGINHLVIAVEAKRDEDGLRDPLYLSGPFGVFFGDDGTPVLRDPPTTGKPHSGVQVGYPYFAGTLCFTRHVSLETLPQEKTFALTFREWDRSLQDCLEVLVNGHSLGTRCWSPYCWEGETTLLRTGRNTIELRLTNTLCGMLEGTHFDASTHRIAPVNDLRPE